MNGRSGARPVVDMKRAALMANPRRINHCDSGVNYFEARAGGANKAGEAGVAGACVLVRPQTQKQCGSTLPGWRAGSTGVISRALR
jgi:hypothetical protein